MFVFVINLVILIACNFWYKKTLTYLSICQTQGLLSDPLRKQKNQTKTQQAPAALT